jgi:hypothetical protein
MPEPQETPATTGPAVLLTEREAAAWARMPLSSFRSIRYRREGPREFRLGRHVRFRHCDLEAWLDRWTSTPEPRD